MWAWGGAWVRPDLRIGRRHSGCPANELSAGPSLKAPTGAAGLICLAWQEAGVHRSGRPAGACHPLTPSAEKGMTVTIVETRTQARAITGGVDTHADVHVAAALDPIGGLLGVQEFPVTPAGYAFLLEWVRGRASPGPPRWPGPPGWPRCGPAPARWSAAPPAWRCASWGGAWSSLTASCSASMS